MKRFAFFFSLLLLSTTLYAQSASIPVPTSTPSSVPTSMPATAPTSLPSVAPTLDPGKLPLPGNDELAVFALTASGQPAWVPNLEVTAAIFSRDSRGEGEPLEKVTASTNSDGVALFRFSKRSNNTEYVVRAFATYDSFVQQAEPMLWAPGKGISLPFALFKRGPEGGKLRLGDDTLVAVFFEDGILIIQVFLDVWNDSDFAYVSKNGKLPLPLASGAFGAVGQNSREASFVSGGGQQQSTLSLDLATKPILPGRSLISFRYHLNAPKRSSIDLEIPLPFPTGKVKVLVQDDPKIDELNVEGFPTSKQEIPPREAGNFIFQSTTGTPSGQRLLINIEGAPYGQPKVIGYALYIAIAMAAIALLLLLVLPKTKEEPARKNASDTSKEEQEKLFADMLALENKHKQNEITTEKYNSQRESLMKKLIALSRRSL